MSSTAKQRYQALETDREDFLRMARDCSALTVPALLPPDGHHPGQELPQPYQSLGARGVVNLSSRIMTAMMPPGMSSFRLSVSAERLREAGENEPGPDAQKALTQLEQVINKEIEARHWRKPTHTSLQYLLVTGNVLERLMPDNSIKLHRLDQFVLVRDHADNLTELVIREQLAASRLDDEMQAMVSGDTQDSVELFTHAKWNGDKWDMYQEIGGQKIPSTVQTVRDLPFTALRWTPVVGESYGRGKCEEHISDLRAYDALRQAALEGAAMASRNINMIRPNAAGGLNLRRRLARAANGEYIVGNPEDVSMLKYDNVQGLDVTFQYAEQLHMELSTAFLLTRGATRDGERVTAYEIRKVVEELEGALGGAYSMLSQDMQAERLRLLIKQMGANGQLPQQINEVTEPVVLTGLQALGREQDVQRVSTALQFLQGLPPEILQDYVKWPVLLGTAMNGLQLPNATRTDQEAQANAQRRAQIEAAQAALQTGGQEMARAAASGGGQRNT